MDPVTQKATPSMSAAHKKPCVSKFKEHLDEPDKVVATYPPNHPPPSPSSSTTSYTTTSQSDHDQTPRHLSASPLAPIRSSSFPTAPAEQKSTGTLLRRILARFKKGKKLPSSNRTPERDANPRLQTRSDPARVETWDRRARLELSEGYLYYHPAFSTDATTTDARSFPNSARPKGRKDVERPWEWRVEEQEWSAVGLDPFEEFSGIHCQEEWSAAGPDPFEGFSGVHCEDHMNEPILVANDVEQDGYQAAEHPKRFMNHLEQRLGRTDGHRDVSGVPLRRYQLVETYVSEAVHYFSDDEVTLSGSWSGGPVGEGNRSY